LEARGEPHNIPERLWAEAKIAQQNRVIADPVEEWLTPLLDGMSAGFLPSDEIRKAFKDQEFDYDRAARSGVISRLASKLGLERDEKKLPSSRLNARGYLKGGGLENRSVLLVLWFAFALRSCVMLTLANGLTTCLLWDVVSGQQG